MAADQMRSADDISDAELRVLIASGIGPVTRRHLLAHFGSSEAIMNAPATAFERIRGIGADLARTIRRALDEADVEAERSAMADAGAQLIMHGDAEYPPLLAAIHDAPAALWVRGKFTHADQMAVAIVGSRRCTNYGREQAGRFAQLLAQSGLTIVSGGAAGVDGEAHRAALRVKGRTVVVVGCGLSQCYPPEHRDLFDRIVRENAGAIVSEFPMRMPPVAKNFPKRNRVISGLSLGVLVIEAALRSGALITARLATEQNREVMALPGRVDSPASAGCLRIIRDGSAAMVLDHADVIQQLDSAGHLMRGAIEAVSTGEAAAKEAMQSLFDLNMTSAQQAILAALEAAGEPLLTDQLAARTQIPLNQLMSELTLLQIRGRIAKDHRGVRLGRIKT